MGRYKKQLRIPEGQERLPFGSRGRKGVLAYALRWEKVLLLSLSCCIAVSMMIYMYAIMSTVIRVSHMKEYESQSSALETSVSRLETTYLSLSEKITPRYAHELGYVNVRQPEFVERSQFFSVNR